MTPHTLRILGVITFLFVATVACEQPKKATTPKTTPDTKTSKQPQATKTKDAEPEKTKPKEDAPKAKQTCIKDIKAHAKAALKKITDDEGAEVMFGEFEDVDGDKQKEKTAFVPLASNAHTVLYVSNNGCLQHAGVFMGTSVSPLKTSTAKHRDIEVWTKNGGCAGLDGSLTMFTWDTSTTMYKQKSEIHCWCPMNTRTKKKRPARCPTAS